MGSIVSSSDNSQYLKKGYVYIVYNSSWPEWCKIGRTNDIKGRLQSYNVNTPIKDFTIYNFWESDRVRQSETVALNYAKLNFESKHNSSGWFKADKEAVNEMVVKLFGKGELL